MVRLQVKNYRFLSNGEEKQLYSNGILLGPHGKEKVIDVHYIQHRMTRNQSKNYHKIPIGEVIDKEKKTHMFIHGPNEGGQMACMNRTKFYYISVKGTE